MKSNHLLIFWFFFFSFWGSVSSTERKNPLSCLACKLSVRWQHDNTWGAWLSAKYSGVLFTPCQFFCHLLKIQCYLLSQIFLPSAYTWLWQWLCGSCSCVPDTNYYNVKWPKQIHFQVSIFKLCPPSFPQHPGSPKHLAYSFEILWWSRKLLMLSAS